MCLISGERIASDLTDVNSDYVSFIGQKLLQNKGGMIDCNYIYDS